MVFGENRNANAEITVGYGMWYKTTTLAKKKVKITMDYGSSVYCITKVYPEKLYHISHHLGIMEPFTLKGRIALKVLSF